MDTAITTNYLIFELNATHYAITAAAVRTTFWLPELAPVQDLPPHFVGLVNHHGEILPIVDLGRRFGHPPRAYRLDQAVVLLEDQGCRVGLVADQVEDLVDLAPDAGAPYVQLAGEAGADAAPVIAGTLKLHDRVLILLDAAALLRLVMQMPAQPMVAAATTGFAPLSPTDRERLRRRTQRLARPAAQPAPADRLYALVRIGPARYAIALPWVAQFTHLGPCTPVPCCPPHILGCVNLRGAILTVLDLAPRLPGTPASTYQDLVVVRCDDRRLGLAVHQIIDIHAATDESLTPATGPAGGPPHCAWMLRDDVGVAGILEVGTWLQPGWLDVNEQV